MNTTRYRFPDEATAKTALAQYVANGQWVTGSHQHALDPVDTLYTAPVLDGAFIPLTHRCKHDC